MDKKFIEFNEILKKDAELQKELKKAKDLESFAKLFSQMAKKKGYDISTDEVITFFKTMKKKFDSKDKLSKEDMEKIAAGCAPFSWASHLRH